MDDLKWFVGFLIFFIIAWVVSGGVFRNVTSPFITPPVPVGGRATDGGQAQARPKAPAKTLPPSGSFAGDLKALEEKSGASSLKGAMELSLGSYGGAALADEYVVVHLSESAPSRALLTGMTLKSEASGRTAVIGKGVYLPQQGTINPEEPIYLEPGSTAHILTGRSPIGYSFRLNTCTGYFGQFQRWTPSLPTECPLPRTEPLPPPPNTLSDVCLEFVDRMYRCRIEPNPPDTLPPECRAYIRNSFTYPRCVSGHKTDVDFYKNEWRIYLSRDNTLWKSTREVISLLDTQGKAVDTVTY